MVALDVAAVVHLQAKEFDQALRLFDGGENHTDMVHPQGFHNAIILSS